LVERRERNMTWNTQSSREAAPGSADDPSDHSWNGASLCPLTRREHHDYCPGLHPAKQIDNVLVGHADAAG
jgi:hypothetical protein